MKKILIGGVMAAAMFGGIAGAAFAANPGYGEQDGYGKASGCGQAHGAFSYFDGDTNLGVKDLGPGTPVYRGGTGQDVGATGYNNSHTNCQS